MKLIKNSIIFIFFFILIILNHQISASTGSVSCQPQSLGGFPPIYSCVAPCDDGFNSSGGNCTITEPNQNFEEWGFCKGCRCYDTDNGWYEYLEYNTGAFGPAQPEAIRCKNSLGVLLGRYPVEQNTQVMGCFWDQSVPSRCNSGSSCTTPCVDTGPGGGGGGTCLDQALGCPQAGQDCADLACSQRGPCSCPCDCEGDGSRCEINWLGVCDNVGFGGPTNTPTPTPTPYCSLICPGQGEVGGYSDSGPGMFTNDGGPQSAPTVMPPNLEGTIDFYGYNGFACASFYDGKILNNCPQPTPGSIGAGDLSNYWQYPQRFNMLCGNQPQTYTAYVVQRTDLYQAGEPTPTEFIHETPTPAPNPPGCNPSGGTPTPTPIGYAEGGSLLSQGGTGSGAGICSCSVQLVCQTEPQIPPSGAGDDGHGGPCDDSCNFSVTSNNGEFPNYNEEVTFDIIVNSEGHRRYVSMDFDDTNTDSQIDAGANLSFNNTYNNAGVYKVALMCSNKAPSDPGNGDQIYCTRTVNVYCDDVTPTVTPAGSPTPTPISWYKFKDSSYRKKSNIIIPIPTSPDAYDSDDTGDCSLDNPLACLIMNNAGILTSQGTIDLGDGLVSKRNWSLDNASSMSTTYSPSVFLTYIRAKKDVLNLTELSAIQDNKISVISGDQTFDNDDNVKNNSLVIIDGNMTINHNGTFNDNAGSPKSTAYVITGTLNISQNTTLLNGIFIADDIDFSYDSGGLPATNPLKINGNIISITDTDFIGQRQREIDPNKPSGFFVFNTSYYFDLLPYLSVKYYDWQEEAP